MPDTKISKVRTCSLEPNFPHEAYIVFLFVLVDGQVNIIPIHKVLTSIKETAQYLKTIIKNMSKTADIDVIDVCSLIPIKFIKRYNLKAEYWKHPTINYTYEARLRLFIPLIQKPQMYQLLITPTFYNEEDNKWGLQSTLPIKDGTSERAVEQFVNFSDVPVDKRAKSAGIYSVERPFELNWKTQKIEAISIFDIQKSSLN